MGFLAMAEIMASCGGIAPEQVFGSVGVKQHI